MIDFSLRAKILPRKAPVFIKYLTVIFIVPLLVACQSIPPKSAICKGLKSEPISQFEFVGKLALSDGEEGGSGRLFWQQKDNRVKAEFKAPMGQGSWSIEEGEQGAIMIIDGEDAYYGEYAQPMVSDVIGWPVPWSALKNWLVALPLDTDEAVIVHQENSMIMTELGWQIEYDRFRQSALGCLPHRIMASRSPYTLRLVIRSWQ